MGLPAHFGHLPVGSPFWRHPRQGEKAAWPLTSVRGHPYFSHLQEPGSVNQESSAQGTLWGVSSPWGPVCLCHYGGHTSKPLAMSSPVLCRDLSRLVGPSGCVTPTHHGEPTMFPGTSEPLCPGGPGAQQGLGGCQGTPSATLTAGGHGSQRT